VGLRGTPFVLAAARYLGQLLYRNVKRFRGRLVCKAHRLVYHSTLGWRVIKKKGVEGDTFCVGSRQVLSVYHLVLSVQGSGVRV